MLTSDILKFKGSELRGSSRFVEDGQTIPKLFYRIAETNLTYLYGDLVASLEMQQGGRISIQVRDSAKPHLSNLKLLVFVDNRSASSSSEDN